MTFPNNIITHAPQTPYWLTTYSNPNYSAPPYEHVYATVGQYIAWFNNQFYNQGCVNQVTPPNSGAMDCYADAKFDDYNTIITSYPLGVAPPSIIMVMGFPISTCSTGNPLTIAPGDGWLGWSGTYNDNYTSDLITRLQQAYPNQFGGIMGWNFDMDFATQNYYGPTGWSGDVSLTLFQSQTPWYGDNLKTWLCLDGNGPADQCANSQSQFWTFSSNSIMNLANNLCLDAGQSNLMYQCFLPSDPYQTWEFLGTSVQNGMNGVIIRNRYTNTCLDGGVAPAFLSCDGGPYQQWTGGNE